MTVVLTTGFRRSRLFPLFCCGPIRVLHSHRTCIHHVWLNTPDWLVTFDWCCLIKPWMGGHSDHSVRPLRSAFWMSSKWSARIGSMSRQVLGPRSLRANWCGIVGGLPESSALVLSRKNRIGRKEGGGLQFPWVDIEFLGLCVGTWRMISEHVVDNSIMMIQPAYRWPTGGLPVECRVKEQ